MKKRYLALLFIVAAGVEILLANAAQTDVDGDLNVTGELWVGEKAGIQTTSPAYSLEVRQPSSSHATILGLTQAGAYDIGMAFTSAGISNEYIFVDRSAAALVLGTNSTPGTVSTSLTNGILLASDGRVIIPGLTGEAADTAVSYDASSKLLHYDTSSIRFKKDIKPWNLDIDKFLQLDVKEFTYKDSGKVRQGFIAEDFDNLGLSEFINYDDEGLPLSLRDTTIDAGMFAVLKNHEGRIESLEEENGMLKEEICRMGGRCNWV